MKCSRVMLVLFAAVLGAAVAGTSHAQPAQTIKIGTLYDHSGPFSAAGRSA